MEQLQTSAEENVSTCFLFAVHLFERELTFYNCFNRVTSFFVFFSLSTFKYLKLQLLRLVVCSENAITKTVKSGKYCTWCAQAFPQCCNKPPVNRGQKSSRPGKIIEAGRVGDTSAADLTAPKHI